MAELDREFLRKLADWGSNGMPVSSLYLNVDGRRFPRKQDYEVRAEELCRQIRQRAAALPREARRSVDRDAGRFREFVRNLERGRTRGVALFSSSGERMWEEVLLPWPLPDRATVAEQPYVLPLEALVETHETFCTVIVDREKARVFTARMGQIEEERDIFDDVPGWHDQGGWSQARFQRHIGAHVHSHLKRVADVLLRLDKRRRFDHFILAGPDELLPHFERELHDYVRRRVAARTSVSMASTPAKVLEKSLQVEEEIEARREERLLDALAQAAARQIGVTGVEPVLEALNEGRVETLVVRFGLGQEGLRCTSCGGLQLAGPSCRTCGGELEPVPDVVDSAVASAMRQGARVETLTMADTDGEGIGAILRF